MTSIGTPADFIWRTISNVLSIRPSVRPSSLAFFSAVSRIFPVPQDFEALLVGLVFRLVELGDLGGVEELREHAVLEELLLAALHLHQELLTVLVLAVHVEHGTAVGLARAQMFGVQVGQFLDLLTTVKQAVDEADQKVLVHLRPKQLLEAKVGVRVDVAVFDVSGDHGYVVYVLSNSLYLPQK